MNKINKENENFFLKLISDGFLSVSKKGVVKNLKTGNVIGKKPGNNGYHSIGWKVNKKTVHILIHRLVYLVHSEDKLCDKFPIVNHKDRNRSNNNIKNLEKSNYEHNKAHAEELGSYEKVHENFSKMYSGQKGSASKITDEEAETIREIKFSKKLTNAELADIFGIHRTNIGRIIRNQSYKTT